jgi:hypothetical protein
MHEERNQPHIYKQKQNCIYIVTENILNKQELINNYQLYFYETMHALIMIIVFNQKT